MPTSWRRHRQQVPDAQQSYDCTRSSSSRSTSPSTSPSSSQQQQQHAFDLRNAFVTVKREQMQQLSQENDQMKTLLNRIKNENGKLFGQNEKLFHLAHFCLEWILHCSSPSSSPKSSPPPTTTTVNSNLEQQSNSIDVIDRFIVNYLHHQHQHRTTTLSSSSSYNSNDNGCGGSDTNRITNDDHHHEVVVVDDDQYLVENFEQFIARYAPAAATTTVAKTSSVNNDNDESTEMSTETGIKVDNVILINPDIVVPPRKKIRKRSLINRLLLKAASITTMTSNQSSSSSSRGGGSGSSNQQKLINKHHQQTSSSSSPVQQQPQQSQQRLHEFFETQQDNQRLVANVNSSVASSDVNGSSNFVANSNNDNKSSTNDMLDMFGSKNNNSSSSRLNYLMCTPTCGNPLKSALNTNEEFSNGGNGTSSNGGQTNVSLSQTACQQLIDSAPRVSEFALFCGVNENSQTNHYLNNKMRKQNEKRNKSIEATKEEEEEEKRRNLLNKKKNEDGDGDVDDVEMKTLLHNQQLGQNNYYYPYNTSGVQLSKPIFTIGGSGSDDCHDRNEKIFPKVAEEEDAEDDDKQSVLSDEVAKSESSSSLSSASGETSCDDDMIEQEMDRMLERIHQHSWFVLPNDAQASVDILTQLNKSVIDLNNIQLTSQVINFVWQEKRKSTSRVVFFYQMFQFLFDKYIKVFYCDHHHPPCAPSVECTLFSKLAVPILKQFLDCVNHRRHLVIQIELLTSIESLIYNRSHYRPAVAEVFHQLFTTGVIEAIGFVEWSKLDDPSAQFLTQLNLTSPSSNINHHNHHNQNNQQQQQQNEMISTTNAKGGNGNGKNSTTKQQNKSSNDNLNINTNNINHLSSSSANNLNSLDTSSQQQQQHIPCTNREQLFQELQKAGFRMFKIKDNKSVLMKQQQQLSQQNNNNEPTSNIQGYLHF